ncbi:MAG: DegV family protein, partial [Clostridia bacterium]|nr:DegV family protein [Clostridia bacterium]
TIDETAEKLDEAKMRLHHVLYVEDTSLLLQSGSPSAPSIVNVKSIFDLTRHGQIGVHSKTLGRKKAITDIIKYVAGTIDQDNLHVLITYTDEEEAKLIASRLAALLPSAEIEYKQENDFVSAYLGENSVCICFFGDERKA